MRRWISGAIVSFVASSGVAQVEPRTTPPRAVPHPVTEIHFGTAVTDRYRSMESRDAETNAWMKAQGAWTRSVLDSITQRRTLLAKLSALGSAFGVIDDIDEAGGKVFYLERAPGHDAADLGVMENGQKRIVLDMGAVMAAHGAIPYAIDWMKPSPDGSKVALGISAGGSEDSQMTVLDVASGRTIAGPIDRSADGGVNWDPNSSGLYFIRSQPYGPGSNPTDKYRNEASDYWDLKTEPRSVLSAAIPGGPIRDPDEEGLIRHVPHRNDLLLIGTTGVKKEIRLWWGNTDTVQAGHLKWTELAGYQDGVVLARLNATTVFLMTHADAPRFKIIAVPIGGTLAEARTVVPADSRQLIESEAVAADGLYVKVRTGLYSRILRVSNDGRTDEIKLPIRGSIGTLTTDVDRPGVLISLESWTTPPAHYRYDPSRRMFVNIGLDTHPSINTAHYAVTDLEAKAKDGALVPLTVVAPADGVKPHTIILQAYGAYGVSNFPRFDANMSTYLDAGIGVAQCAVRGGGELGEAWRLGGKDANKPNTWLDAIACAETLISKGYTTPALLTVSGTSAGGIMVGRAVTERPDLFAAAIDRVGDVNALRMETMPAGPANIPEFGTVKDERGFKNLYAMDVIQHVKPGVRYPAFLITAGLNDARIEPWAGAKLAATLEENPNHRPVLFRLEEQAGHGFGSTKSTLDAEAADIAAFVLWRTGNPDWQPR